MNYSDLKKVVDDIADYAKDIRECAQAYANNASTTLDRDYSVKDIVFCINEMEKCKQEIANNFGLTEKEVNNQLSEIVNNIARTTDNVEIWITSAISEENIEKKSEDSIWR